MKTIAIMQPTYLPWLGYFDLMDQVDAFVLLDDVAFSKQSWQQRNRIKTPRGLEWLTVPVRSRLGQAIHEIELGDPNFWHKHARTIAANYARAAHTVEATPPLLDALEHGAATGHLATLNATLIGHLAAVFDIATPIVAASSLAVEGRRSERLVALCRRLGATRYLSPVGAAEYLTEDAAVFEDAGIDVVFHHYEHPEYPQPFGAFTPFASAIDLLLNAGAGCAGEILRSGRRKPHEKL